VSTTSLRLEQLLTAVTHAPQEAAKLVERADISARDSVAAIGGLMLVGERLKALREQKKLSQADIEKRTGLLRCYISRFENGHTVPAIETLEKLARAMEVPMYQLFYDGEKPPAAGLPRFDDDGWGSSRRDSRSLVRFCRLLSRISKHDQKLLLAVAQKMSQKKTR
jgi:transcriptional regulator with XRE-family HTH domain